MEELAKASPRASIYTIVYNPTDFIAESIHEVNKTLSRR